MKLTIKSLLLIISITILIAIGILNIIPKSNKAYKPLPLPSLLKRDIVPTNNPKEKFSISGVIKEVDQKLKTFLIQDTTDIYGKGKTYKVLVDNKTIISGSSSVITKTKAPQNVKGSFKDISIGSFLNVKSSIAINNLTEFTAIEIQLITEPEVVVKDKNL